MDDGANAACRGFFKDTLTTLQGSYVRPTHPGFIAFFHESTRRLQAAVVGGESPAQLADWLDQRYRATLPTVMAEGAQ